MQTAINTDVFVMNVMETLMGQMEMWAEQERDRLDKVQAALYMNLMNKTIIVDDGPQRQLPAEYVDDTPRVIEMFLRCKQLEKRTENTLENYRGELKCLFRYVNKNFIRHKRRHNLQNKRQNNMIAHGDGLERHVFLRGGHGRNI